MLPIKLKYINNALVRGGKNSSFANLGFGAVGKFANVLFCAGGVVFQSAHQAQSAWEKKLKPFALLLALVVFILSF